MNEQNTLKPVEQEVEPWVWPESVQTDHCSSCEWWGPPVGEDRCPECGDAYCLTRAVGATESEPSRASIDMLEMTPAEVAAELQELRDNRDDCDELFRAQVTELQSANTREVETRREAEAKARALTMRAFRGAANRVKGGAE